MIFGLENGLLLPMSVLIGLEALMMETQMFSSNVKELNAQNLIFQMNLLLTSIEPLKC
jgi:hypothetical protein